MNEPIEGENGKAKRRPEFDPSLDAVCAATWWDFGKLIAQLGDQVALEKRLKAIQKDLHPDLRAHVTAESVREFAQTVLDLLRRLYDGDSITADVERLIEQPSGYKIRETDRFLELDEPYDTFWAVEYQNLFASLSKPHDPKDNPEGWLNAVAKCQECGEFFVKQRKDQIFDKARCRTRFANRDAYLATRRGSRRRGHRK